MALTKTKMIIEVNDNINTIATAVQMDANSRYLDVYLYDHGIPVDLTGHVVRINVKRKGHTPQFDQGEITDATAGRCQFRLQASMLKLSGELEAQISIWNGEAEILSTKIFKILVTESLRDDKEIEATNEFGVLVVLFTEIQNALELMQEMTKTFGLPGEMASSYGVDSFWGMLEHLAANADVVNAINSRVNSDTSKALDKKMDAHMSALNTFLLGGNVPIIRHSQKGLVTVARTSKTATVTLSGFKDAAKMLVFLNGTRINAYKGSTSEVSGVFTYHPYVESVTETGLTVYLDYITIDKDNGGSDATISYQVVELY